MTNHSLLFGWWGLFSFFGTFYAVGQNLVNRRKVVQLAQPTPTVTSEGSRLIRRPGPYVAVALLGFVGYLGVGAATTSDGEALDGECVVIEGDTLRATRCSSDHDGKVIAVLRTDSTDRCPRSTDDALVLDSDPDHVLCLDLDG